MKVCFEGLVCVEGTSSSIMITAQEEAMEKQYFYDSEHEVALSNLGFHLKTLRKMSQL